MTRASSNRLLWWLWLPYSLAENTVMISSTILGQLFLENRLLALVDDHDLNALQFAQRKYQLGAKAHQTVLMILCISKVSVNRLGITGG